MYLSVNSYVCVCVCVYSAWIFYICVILFLISLGEISAMYLQVFFLLPITYPLSWDYSYICIRELYQLVINVYTMLLVL